MREVGATACHGHHCHDTAGRQEMSLCLSEPSEQGKGKEEHPAADDHAAPPPRSAWDKCSGCKARALFYGCVVIGVVCPVFRVPADQWP